MKNKIITIKQNHMAFVTPCINYDTGDISTMFDDPPKPKTKIYMATVRIAVKAGDENDACDAISLALTEELLYRDMIVDWGYVKENGEYTGPTELGYFDQDDLEEDLFGKLDTGSIKSTVEKEKEISINNKYNLY